MRKPGGFIVQKGVLTGYKGSESDAMVPAGVTAIGKRAFLFCRHLQYAALPRSVLSIGDEAFAFTRRPSLLDT